MKETSGQTFLFLCVWLEGPSGIFLFPLSAIQQTGSNLKFVPARADSDRIHNIHYGTGLSQQGDVPQKSLTIIMVTQWLWLGELFQSGLSGNRQPLVAPRSQQSPGLPRLALSVDCRCLILRDFQGSAMWLSCSRRSRADYHATIYKERSKPYCAHFHQKIKTWRDFTRSERMTSRCVHDVRLERSLAALKGFITSSLRA
jgi:hypothetical protein